jgi:hypothetical protein
VASRTVTRVGDDDEPAHGPPTKASLAPQADPDGIPEPSLHRGLSVHRPWNLGHRDQRLGGAFHAHHTLSCAMAAGRLPPSLTAHEQKPSSEFSCIRPVRPTSGSSRRYCCHDLARSRPAAAVLRPEFRWPRRVLEAAGEPVRHIHSQTQPSTSTLLTSLLCR